MEVDGLRCYVDGDEHECRVVAKKFSQERGDA